MELVFETMLRQFAFTDICLRLLDTHLFDERKCDFY